MAAAFDASRRAWLRGDRTPVPVAPRLPWLLPEAFFAGCTRCGACLDACPERVIAAGDGGLPGIDFERGGCTFCGACRARCPLPLFDRDAERPWAYRVGITGKCLTRHGIVCRSCQDACAAGAIRFAPGPARVAVPVLDDEACTGCGACVGVCPVSATAWRPPAAADFVGSELRP